MVLKIIFYARSKSFKKNVNPKQMKNEMTSKLLVIFVTLMSVASEQN